MHFQSTTTDAIIVTGHWRVLSNFVLYTLYADFESSISQSFNLPFKARLDLIINQVYEKSLPQMRKL